MTPLKIEAKLSINSFLYKNSRNARFARIPLVGLTTPFHPRQPPGLVLQMLFSHALRRTDTGRTYGDPRGVIGGLLYETESIFNVIFEIYAIFTCYLTYYKPSAKKKL